METEKWQVKYSWTRKKMFSQMHLIRVKHRRNFLEVLTKVTRKLCILPTLTSYVVN